MSGWRRLWIVASVLLGIPAGVIAWDVNDRSFAYVDWTPGSSSEAFWDRARKNPELSDCISSTMETSGSAYQGSIAVVCDNKGVFDKALLWSLAPGAIMAALGLTIRWVYRGFRPPAK